MNNHHFLSFISSEHLWSCVVPTWVRVEARFVRWSGFPATAFHFIACKPVDTTCTTSPTSPMSRGSTTWPRPSPPARSRLSDTGRKEPQRAAIWSVRPPDWERRHLWPVVSAHGRWWWQEEGDTLASGWGKNWPIRGCQWSFWTWISLPLISLKEQSSIRYGTVERALEILCPHRFYFEILLFLSFYTIIWPWVRQYTPNSHCYSLSAQETHH